MQVRATKDTWNYIENQISTMFSARHQHAQDWYSYGLSETEFNQIIWDDIVTPRQQELMNELGNTFFRKDKENLTVMIKSAVISVAYSVPCKGKLVPEQWFSWHDSDRPKVTDERIANIAVSRNNKIAAVGKEHTEFKAMVKKIYDACTSVNRFIKLWPPGRDLLPPNVIEQLNKKAERSASSQPNTLSPEQLAQLNVNLLRARVAA